MIEARFFIGDEPIAYMFDETTQMRTTIDHLAMLHYEKLGILPHAIFLSMDLYKIVSTQNVRYSTQMPVQGVTAIQFLTGLGIIMVKPVSEPSDRFIYAGNQQGYENALIDKKFEEIVLGEANET